MHCCKSISNCLAVYQVLLPDQPDLQQPQALLQQLQLSEDHLHLQQDLGLNQKPHPAITSEACIKNQGSSLTVCSWVNRQFMPRYNSSPVKEIRWSCLRCFISFTEEHRLAKLTHYWPVLQFEWTNDKPCFLSSIWESLYIENGSTTIRIRSIKHKMKDNFGQSLIYISWSSCEVASNITSHTQLDQPDF